MKTIRKSVSRNMQEQIPQLFERALSFMRAKYPDIDFENVDFIFTGAGRRGRYYRNEVLNAKHMKPTVFAPTHRIHELMYFKPSLGMVRQEVKEVGCEDVFVSCIIHELTHHVQYERGDNRRGELETTANELEYYKQFRPDVYELFMN